MGMIGRWIDSLDDASRDRIIEHPDPTFDGEEWWSLGRDCGCLVGCVLGKKAFVFSHLFGAFVPRQDFGHTEDVGARFPELTERFGAERMWRLVKARAARGNRVEIPAVAEEAVTV